MLQNQKLFTVLGNTYLIYRNLNFATKSNMTVPTKSKSQVTPHQVQTENGVLERLSTPEKFGWVLVSSKDKMSSWKQTCSRFPSARHLSPFLSFG